jgi:hypothetical protein
MVTDDSEGGQPLLYPSLLNHVVVKPIDGGRREAIVAAWVVADLRRFHAKFDSEGRIETDLPTREDAATSEPVAISLLTMVGSPDGQPVAWAVVFWGNKGTWFKFTAPRYSEDSGLSVAQDALALCERRRLNPGLSSELIVSQDDVPTMIEDWLCDAYSKYLGSMMAS